MHGPNPGLNYVQCLHSAPRTEAIPRHGISVPQHQPGHLHLHLAP